jgi:hypothetical protein
MVKTPPQGKSFPHATGSANNSNFHIIVSVNLSGFKYI